MQALYHIQLTRQALEPSFSPQAIEAILAANLGQDRVAGLIGHPEYHFDDSQFERGEAYLEAQRAIVLATLGKSPSSGSQKVPPTGPHLCSPAWRAFGRLLHAAQDYYAHSNYAALWLATAQETLSRTSYEVARDASLRFPEPEEIDPLNPQLLNSPALKSGRTYLPWEALVYIPFLGPLVKRLLPRDSHTWMNLDGPGQGKLFPYALAAARKRTEWETQHLSSILLERFGPEALSFFRGFSS